MLPRAHDASPAGPPSPRRAWPLLVVAVLLSCDGGGPASPDAVVARLEFGTTTVQLETGDEASVVLLNSGDVTLGPIALLSEPVRTAGGAAVPGASLVIEPSEVPTLAPGDERALTLRVDVGGSLQPGSYSVKLTARAGTEASAELSVGFDVEAGSGPTAATVEVGGAPDVLRQGDVVGLVATARDDEGAVLQGVRIDWSVEPVDAGFFGEAGRFVAYRPGPVRLVATAGGARDSVDLTVQPRNLSGSFARVGTGRVRLRHTSDLWVKEDHAYTGTWSSRRVDGTLRFGNTLYAWDVSNPAAPLRTDSVVVDARTVNDVKVHPARPLGVITHEGSVDGLNGITLLDLTDPGHPRPITRFTEGLASGVHNAWLDGDHLYLVLDGVGSGLRILDVSDPATPRIVASFWAGSSFLHDVYVRDGLAFLAHWNAGLIILDVGAGMAGGSPENPVEVSRVSDLGGQTHNAWYWPDAGYVFVGEEDHATPGRMRVVDVGDLRRPRVVATFDVPRQTPHNFWLDEARGELYISWYGQGIRALDVKGELMGDLSRQGREIAGRLYEGGSGSCGGDATCSWAPQLHDGRLFIADVNHGLVILDPEF